MDLYVSLPLRHFAIFKHTLRHLDTGLGGANGRKLMFGGWRVGSRWCGGAGDGGGHLPTCCTPSTSPQRSDLRWGLRGLCVVVVVLLLVCSRQKTWPDSCCLVLFVCFFSKKKVIKILFAIFTSALCRREGWGNLWFYGECLVSAAGCAWPPREHVWKSREVPVPPIYQNAIKIKRRQYHV